MEGQECKLKPYLSTLPSHVPGIPIEPFLYQWYTTSRDTPKNRAMMAIGSPSCISSTARRRRNSDAVSFCRISLSQLQSSSCFFGIFSCLHLDTVDKRPNVPDHRLPPESRPVRFIPNRKRAAIRCNGLCTPGMGVSVGVQVPCRRFTVMSESIPEDNSESKARASP